MANSLPPLRLLTVFETLARTGGVRQAATELNVTQPAISQALRQLEDHVGTKLLDRRTRPALRTEAGQILEAAVTEGLGRIADAIDHIRSLQLSTETVTIACSVGVATYWLMPRLAKLRQAMPDIDISISTSLADNLGERSQLDCAIRFGDGEWPMLEARHLMAERHIAVAAPALLDGWSPGDRPDLSRFTFLHVLSSSTQRYLTWQHWLDAAGLADVDTRGGLEFDLLDLAIEAAVNGLGITVADRAMIAPQLESGQLVPLMDVEIGGHQSYWLVTRKERTESEPVERFRAWLAGEIG